MGNYITVNNIKKKFGDIKALDGISFSIEKGEIYGLLGPNGAGKTTTIRTILGIILPDSGNVEIRGNSGKNLRDIFGYLPEERGLYRKMKVKDIITFFGRSKGVYGETLQKRMDFWLERMELQKYKNKKIEELSKGMQQKIQFITTIINNPEIVILDEPFSGLDPINRDVLKDIMLSMSGDGKTIIYSTHNMEEAEKLSNSICLINKGKVILEGRLHEVKERYGVKSIVAESDSDLTFLREKEFFNTIDVYKNYVEFTLKEEHSVEDILRYLLDRKIGIRKFQIVEPSLRKIFITMVNKDKSLTDEVSENGKN